MADRQTALAVIDKLKESGLSEDAIHGRLKSLTPDQRNAEYDKLATRFGLVGTAAAAEVAPAQPFDRSQMTFTPDNPAVDRGRRLIEQRNIGTAGTIGRGVAESQFLGKGEEVIGLARSALPGSPDALQSIQEEKDIQSALRKDRPLSFAGGEIVGFLGGLVGAGTKAIGKGAALGYDKAIPIVQKLYPAIQNNRLLQEMAKAFVVGGSQIGLFEGAKEVLESGDVKEAAKKGLSAGISGGLGAAGVTGAVATLARRFTANSVEKAIEKGFEVQSLERAAAREGKKAEGLIRNILNTDDPTVIEPILKNPQTVERLVKNGEITDFTIGQRLQREYQNLRDGLISTVGKLKSRVRKDTKADINTSFLRKALVTAEKKFTTAGGTREVIAPGYKFNVKGTSVLGRRELEDMQKVKDLLLPDQISASDALLTVEAIDEMVNWENRAASNISESAASALKVVRRALKLKLHRKYPEYSKSDAALTEFFETSSGVARQLNNNPEQFVRNMFGANKTAIRRDLIKLRGLAKRVDPSTAGKTMQIAGDVSALRGAKAIKEAQFPLRRTTQEITNETARRYANKGTAVGASIGTYIGSLAGGFVGATVGGTTGAAVGRVTGQAIGKKVGNPMRILNAALKSKALSARAKMIAKDLQRVTVADGIDGFSLMMDAIPATAKGAEELGRFILDNSSLKSNDLASPDVLNNMRNSRSVDNLVDQSLSLTGTE